MQVEIAHGQWHARPLKNNGGFCAVFPLDKDHAASVVLKGSEVHAEITKDLDSTIPRALSRDSEK